MEYVKTKEQIVDIFTKPLPRETFEYLRQKLGSDSLPKGSNVKTLGGIPFALNDKEGDKSERAS